MKIFKWAGIIIAGFYILSGLQYLVGEYTKMSVRYASTDWIDIDDTIHDHEFDLIRDQRRSLRVAIAPVLSPSRSVINYRDIVIYLANRLNFKPEIITRKTYLEINDLIQHRQCDLALVCTYPYVIGKRKFNMEIVATPFINQSSHYQSLILVGKNSEINSLLDLRQKRFAINDYHSSSGWLYPALALLRQGIIPDSFFSKVLITQCHDFSVDALCSGRVDGTAVNSAAFDFMMRSDPTIKDHVKVIARSESWGLPPFVVHPDLPQELKRKLREMLLDMDKNPEGLQILKKMGIDNFFVPPKGFYDNIEKDVLELESDHE